MRDVFRIAAGKIGPMDREVLSSRYTIDFGGKSSDLNHEELLNQAKTLYESNELNTQGQEVVRNLATTVAGLYDSLQEAERQLDH